MTPGSDSARSLEDGTINRPKEGKGNSAPAPVRLGYLYHTQAETSKHTCVSRWVRAQHTRTFVGSDFLKQVIPGRQK